MTRLTFLVNLVDSAPLPPSCHYQCCVKWNDLDLSRNFYNKNKVWEIKPSCLIFGCQCNLKIFFQFLPMYSFYRSAILTFFWTSISIVFYCFSVISYWSLHSSINILYTLSSLILITDYFCFVLIFF